MKNINQHITSALLALCMLLPIVVSGALPYSRPKFKTPMFKSKQMVELAKLNYFTGNTNRIDSTTYFAKVRESLNQNPNVHFKYCCVILYYSGNVLTVEQTKSQIDCFDEFSDAISRFDSHCKTLEDNGWQQFYFKDDVNVQGNEKKAYMSNDSTICVIHIVSVPFK